MQQINWRLIKIFYLQVGTFMNRYRNIFSSILDLDFTRCFSSNVQNKLHQLIMDMKKDIKPSRPKQKSKYAAANVTLQVLGSGAKGTPSSLYVFSDQSRYVYKSYRYRYIYVYSNMYILYNMCMYVCYMYAT